MSSWKTTDANGVLKLDFKHPRVIAAMKITGIQQSDFSNKPLLPKVLRSGALSARLALTDKGGDKEKEKSGASTARGDALARTEEFWERKQRQLLKDLEETAEAMTDADVDAILTSDIADLGELQEEFNKQKAIVDRMRDRLGAQLRRDGDRALARSTAQDAAAKERDALAKLLEERFKEKRDALAAAADKRNAEHAKARERVKAGWKQAREARDAITQRLATQDERVTKMLEERNSGENSKTQELKSRMARIAEQRMAHEQMTFEDKVRRVEETLRREEEVSERLVRAREEAQAKLEEKQSKFSGRLNQVLEKQQQQDRAREKAFLQNSKKMDAARALVTENTKAVLQASKDVRNKRLNTWTTNREKIGKETRERRLGIKDKVETMVAKAEENREKHYDDMVFSKAATRGLLEDVVEQNKVRIDRSDECARQQTLTKVERDMLRIETAHQQKQLLESHRVRVIKESLEGRTKVDELQRLDPAAGPTSAKRVNEILRSLGMPPLQLAAPSKEGEEGQQQ
mmetsp:Transcript_47494/g.119691  ORF Transcript_47494/g.119691 Transcript_47494/m.119691 type:complete len:519 (-) Transcript_47494:87-1643(-)